jgi:hypothetical protein
LGVGKPQVCRLFRVLGFEAGIVEFRNEKRTTCEYEWDEVFKFDCRESTASAVNNVLHGQMFDPKRLNP